MVIETSSKFKSIQNIQSNKKLERKLIAKSTQELIPPSLTQGMLPAHTTTTMIKTPGRLTDA